MAISVYLDDSSDFGLTDVELYHKLLLDCIGAIGVVGECECYLSFISAEAMAELNKAHMGKDGPTDVLSFAVSFEPEFDLEIPRILGEIMICPEVAAANAGDHSDGDRNGSLGDEIALLVVHGLLHLSGMDHEIESEALVMEAAEAKLLGEFYRRRSA